ncbi:MAG: hypothetical protein HRT61_01420 [Ekhidna sp.]|nr:hypothetical protein [Ekhidna sp.]
MSKDIESSGWGALSAKVSGTALMVNHDDDDDKEIVDIVLEDDDPKEEVELDDDDSEEDEDDERQKVAPQEDEDDPEEDDDEPKSKRKSRAKQRIETLARKANEAEQQLEAERLEKEALAKRMAEMEAQMAEAQNSSLDTRIEQLKAEKARLRVQIRDAMRDEDLDTQIDLEDQLSVINAKLVQAETTAKVEIKEPPKEDKLPQKQSKRQATPNNSQLAEQKAQSWIDDNDWVQNPESRAERKLQTQARKAMNELISEGYTLEDDDFYTELEKDLKKYAQDNNVEVEGYYVKQKTKRQRTGPTQKNEKGATKKVTYRISKEDREFCKRMGISEKDFVRARENAKANDGLARPIR